MNRQSWTVLIGIIVLLLGGWGGAYIFASDTRVTFADENFKQAVIVSLGTERPLKEYDLQQITTLNLRGRHIESLDDLRHFPNLQQLNVRENAIRDLDPIKYTPNIEQLDIEENFIQDLTPVSTLTQLRTLDAENNQIESIEPLTNLTGLVDLNLRNNRITSLEPLANLTYLETLNVRDNQIEDISTLQHLFRLQDLNLRNNLITDFSPLQDLQDLTQRVYVRGNPYDREPTLNQLYNQVRDVDFGDPALQVNMSEISGTYRSPFELSLESQREGVIRYTLDGSEPTLASDAYSSPIVIQETTTVRAKLFLANGETGETATRTYLMNESTSGTLPILAISIDPAHLFDEKRGIYVAGEHYDPAAPVPELTGNYMMRGSNWERPIQVSYFDQNGATSPLFTQPAGIRMYWGDSLETERKSFLLYSRGEYGQHVFTPSPLLSTNDQSDKRLIVSHGQKGDLSFIRHSLIHEAAKDINVISKESKPISLVVNNENWGLYHLTEYYDHHYFELTYQIDPRQLDLLEGNDKTSHGTRGSYDELVAYAMDHPLQQTDHFNYVSSQIDLASFIDFFIIQTYFQNKDLSQSTYWRDRGGDNKWRWAINHVEMDLENQLVDFEDFLHYHAESELVQLLLALLENQEFKQQFIDQYTERLQTTLSPENLSTLAIQLKEDIQANISSLIPISGNPSSVAEWEEANEELLYFLEERASDIHEQLLTF
ncbi:leucine-rich repeat domain-containing protein [Halalkalibacter kiskunsagensis]|uniref:Leucine-rich repeat domain-containing protein n=1 Tax=Halalkalibacter kiskunsagensis TaxID=1548599 RepID=A0ABV6KD56_9BACI